MCTDAQILNVFDYTATISMYRMQLTNCRYLDIKNYSRSLDRWLVIGVPSS
jgi:hypothetical protein